MWFFKNAEPIGYGYTTRLILIQIYERICYGNWLRWSWRSRSLMIGRQQPENWGSHWSNSIWICLPENQEIQWCKPQSKEESLRTWMWLQDAVSPQIRRPGNQELQCLTAGKDGCPGSRWERELPLFHLFILSGPLTDWMMPAQTGKGGSSWLCLLIQMWISWNTLTNILRSNGYSFIMMV